MNATATVGQLRSEGAFNLPSAVDEIRCNAGTIAHKLEELFGALNNGGKTPEPSPGPECAMDVSGLCEAARHEQQKALAMLEQLQRIVMPVP